MSMRPCAGSVTGPGPFSCTSSPVPLLSLTAISGAPIMGPEEERRPRCAEAHPLGPLHQLLSLWGAIVFWASVFFADVGPGLLSDQTLGCVGKCHASSGFPLEHSGIHGLVSQTGPLTLFTPWLSFLLPVTSFVCSVPSYWWLSSDTWSSWMEHRLECGNGQP